MKIIDVEFFPVKAKVRPIEEGGIAPYRGSRDGGAGTSVVTSALYKVRTDEGIDGWGEMNMILSLCLTRAIFHDVLRPALIGSDPFDRNRIMGRIESLYNPDINMLHFASGVEMALWDIMGKATGRPVYQLLGGAARLEAPIAYAMGMMDDVQTAQKLEQIRREGYRAVKTKGGCDVAWDIRRAHRMRELAGEEMAIRVDMNQSYSLTQAAAYLSAVKDCRLEYVEQPLCVNALEDYRALRLRAQVPIAINEDCYLPGGLFRALRMGAVDAAVVDMESLGGIWETVKLAHIAQAANVPLAHHCAWDMGIKTAAIIHAVCALPAFSLPMDSTYPSHAQDPLRTSLAIRNGAYQLPRGPGLGIDVDEEKVCCMVSEDKSARYVF